MLVTTVTAFCEAQQSHQLLALRHSDVTGSPRLPVSLALGHHTARLLDCFEIDFVWAKDCLLEVCATRHVFALTADTGAILWLDRISLPAEPLAKQCP